MGSCLRIVHRLLRRRRRQEEWAPSFYRGQSVVHHGRYLARLFQDHYFFQSRPATGHSHAISSWPYPTTLSSVLLVPLALSSCSYANGGIELLAISSSECLSL